MTDGLCLLTAGNIFVPKICQPTNKELHNLQKYVGRTEQHTLEKSLAKEPFGKPANRLNADLKMSM